MSSSIEVELLARFSRASSPDGNENDPWPPSDTSERWQEEVLYFWFIDDANLPPSAYEATATMAYSYLYPHRSI